MRTKACCVTLILCQMVRLTTSGAVREGQIAGTEDGVSCPPLKNLDHGKYSCTKEGQILVCRLICIEGYVVPLTEYRDQGHIQLAERATYRCTFFPGGYAWEPNIFFDCIEKRGPSHYVLYFPITIHPVVPCSGQDKDNVQIYTDTALQHISHSNVQIKCELHMDNACSWDLKMVCTNGSWLVDLFLRINFSQKAHENYQEWKELILRSIQYDVGTAQGLGLRANHSDMEEPIFYVECPKGSKLEPDYTCRGCSKGYYMDHSLMECQPCPVGQFQDQDYQASCQSCPEGDIRSEIALQDRISCFYLGKWARKTNYYTFLVTLASIVAVCSLLLSFRGQVLNEPDGIRREHYMPDPVPDRNVGGRLQKYAYYASTLLHESKTLSSVDNVTKRLSAVSAVGDSTTKVLQTNLVIPQVSSDKMLVPASSYELEDLALVESARPVRMRSGTSMDNVPAKAAPRQEGSRLFTAQTTQLPIERNKERRLTNLGIAAYEMASVKTKILEQDGVIPARYSKLSQPPPQDETAPSTSVPPPPTQPREEM